MYYIMLDVTNLSKWFAGTAPYAAGSGALASNNTGYSVYFSDRRENRDPNSLETAEYGWEDDVNPATAAGLSNGVLDDGEDVNGDGVLQTYGQLPSYNGVQDTVPPGAAAPLDLTARPTTLIGQGQGQVNRAILFRHALKLINGGLGSIIAPGLTVVAENPVYVQGDWNMNAYPPPANDGHVATSVIADAVTLLSNNWNDTNAFINPYNPANRSRSANSYVRLAIVAGKNPSFSWVAGPEGWGAATDFGTDGGAHNFLRMLESNNTVNYQGSLVTFFYSRQGTGIYKCCNTVYTAPTRNFSFDTDFLNPALLPPLTPVFRDLDTIGFSQEIRPGK